MKKYFFLLMLSAGCYAQVLTPDEKGNTLLLLDVPSATKVNADLAAKLSITNIAQSLASGSSSDVPSVAAVNKHLTNGTSSLAISNLTVLGSAILPSITTTELTVSNLTGSGVTAIKERVLQPMYGIGVYTPTIRLATNSSTYMGMRLVYNESTRYPLDPLATGVVVQIRFGDVGTATNFGCRINVGYQGINLSNQLAVTAATLNAIPNINFTCTNQIITIPVPLSTTTTNAWKQLIVSPVSNSVDGTLLFPTNGVWIGEVKEQF